MVDLPPEKMELMVMKDERVAPILKVILLKLFLNHSLFRRSHWFRNSQSCNADFVHEDSPIGLFTSSARGNIIRGRTG